MAKVIYTHDMAANIVDMFENVLDKYNIKVPSPEDDEREEDNDAKLYGSVYSDLLDSVENYIGEIIEEVCHNMTLTVVSGEFSGGSKSEN